MVDFYMRNVEASAAPTFVADNAVASNQISICNDLGIRVVAERIETKGERDFFVAHGVSLMQGYFFARPGFRSIPAVDKATYLP